jgi:predicted transposase YbfD/YdcC
LSSLSSNAEKLPLAIRSHWGIENSLHWTLDFTFSEDESRIRSPELSQKFCTFTPFSHKFTETRENF